MKRERFGRHERRIKNNFMRKKKTFSKADKHNGKNNDIKKNYVLQE